jgi:hypothetical protein
MKFSFHVHPKSFTMESKQGIDKSRGRNACKPPIVFEDGTREAREP